MDSSDDDDTLEESVVVNTDTLFRYPVGTKIAMKFSSGMFFGEVTKLFPGKDLCLVVFTDGDQAEYDVEEIQYANELYKHEMSKN